jgi:hypothetical protein
MMNFSKCSTDTEILTFDGVKQNDFRSNQDG